MMTIGTKKQLFSELVSKLGVSDGAKFVVVLKRLAEIPRRMKEFEKLGKLINKRF